MSRSIELVGAIPDGYTFAGRLLEERIPGGDLYRCADCSLAFKWPRLSKSELSALYQKADASVWEYDAVRRKDWVLARDVLDDGVGPRKILDVGCFDGAFLKFLCESTTGWDPYGIEINEKAATMAASRGVQVVGSDADDVDALEVYDAVVAFDLIEHLHDPADFLESLARQVTPGGVVVISTGNIDSSSWRLMGARYWYCVLPEHLSFLSPEWCRKIAIRLDLSVERMDRFSHSTNSGPAVRLSEAAKNAFYRVFPAGFRLLRRLGMGGVDLSSNPSLADTPPIWLSAKDHFLVVFRKAKSSQPTG